MKRSVSALLTVLVLTVVVITRPSTSAVPGIAVYPPLTLEATTNVDLRARMVTRLQNATGARVQALPFPSGLAPDSLMHGLAVNADGVPRSVATLLAHPDIDVARLAAIWPDLANIPPAIAEQLEIDAMYAGYLDRQARDIAAFRRDETLLLPEALDYAAIGGLSAEIRGKLARARPVTLGAASRISGVTPAALVALLRYVKQRPEAA